MPEISEAIVEKEAIYLATILRDKEQFLEGSTIVNTDSLSAKNAIIYHASQQVFQSGGDVSFESVAYHLNDTGMLGEIGGMSYLEAVRGADFRLDGLAFKRLCHDLENAGRTRKIKLFLSDIVGGVDLDPEEIIGTVVDFAHRLSQGKQEDMSSIGAILEDEDKSEGRKVMTPTPIATLDTLLDGGGVVSSDYMIIAARPSVGKTAFAGQLAVIAALGGVPTLIFSLEQSKKSLARRLKRYVDEDVLRDLPIWVNSTASITIDQILYHTQMAQITKGIKLVIIDYIGLIKGKRANESANDFITRVSGGLQAMARNMDIGVVALSQLNRDPDREAREPMLHDLRDSGSLEQDADVIIFLHRPKKGDTGKIILAKQREGPIGAFMARFDPDTVMWLDQ